MAARKIPEVPAELAGEDVAAWARIENERLVNDIKADQATLKGIIRLAWVFAAIVSVGLVLATVAVWRYYVATGADLAQYVQGLDPATLADTIRDGAAATGSAVLWGALAVLVLFGADLAGWTLTDAPERDESNREPLHIHVKRIKRKLAKLVRWGKP